MKFTFDWLFSKERKKLQQKVEELEQKVEELYSQPYKKVRSIDGNITVVLNNGDILNGKEEGLLEKIVEAKSEEEVIRLLKPKEESKEIIVPEDDLLIFKDNADFEIKDGKLYLKDINCVIPELIVATFIEILEKQEGEGGKLPFLEQTEKLTELQEQFEALRLFTLKLFLNPIESSRNDLLRFIKNNDIRLTNTGNLILYRNLVAIGETEKKLTEFISANYFKVKAQKKSPKNYWIWAEDDGSFTLLKEKPQKESDGIGSHLGNLYDLYSKIGELEENNFTSWHNKGKYNIQIGKLYKIDDADIDLDNTTCHSGGLHAAHVGYNYSGYGDTKVVVLVSPAKAITVPLGDMGKLRTTEMFICCINDKEYGEHFEETEVTSFDEEYNNLTVTELEESIRNKSFSAVSIQDEVANLTPIDMECVKEILKNRINKI